MTMKQSLKAGLAGLLMTVAALQAAQAQVPGVTADTIKIGTFGALTGPGYLYGKLPMNGVEVVFDEVNAAGGINGRKLELVREDDRCDPAAAIGAVKKLIHQDQVFAIIGGGCSNATFAAREAIEKAKMPVVIFASVHDGITTPAAPNIFSTALTSTIESQAQLEFALDQGAKRIAIVSMRDAWGRSRYTPLMEAFKKKGITPVADEEMAPDANDATAQVLRLKAANADAVMMRALSEARRGLHARRPEARLQAARDRPERHRRPGRLRGAGRRRPAPRPHSAPSRWCATRPRIRPWTSGARRSRRSSPATGCRSTTSSASAAPR